MPCYVCNPQCGKCRPSRPKPVKCKACGKLTMPEVEDVLRGRCSCRECENDLPLPESLWCAFCGKHCRIPCARARKEPEDGIMQECPWGYGFEE